MVRPRDEHLRAAAAELNGDNRAAASRAGERFDVGKRRDAAQLFHVLFLKPGGHVPGRNRTEQENRLHHSL